MAFRKNKKFIDPRYFMDEKTDVVKEGFTTTGPDPRDALSTKELGKLMDAGYESEDLRNLNRTNLTPKMKDALEGEYPTYGADSFSGHLSLSNSIRDAIIGHLENEKLFEMGTIPQSVIRVIENSSLRIADAAEGME
tara:strand:+ start:43 stop:453 length:411 start_codon:yes stop_codon:yes gene_type:complete